MTTFILIHGINNQGNSIENIESTWSQSLSDGAASAGLVMPRDVKFKAVFYGDLLFQETTNWQKIEAPITPMSATSPDDDYADDNIASLYLEFQRKYGITDNDVKKELDMNDDPRSHKRMAKGIHKKWLKAIARSIEKCSPLHGEAIAQHFLPQAAAYLYKPQLKEKIDNLVKDQMLEALGNDPNLVIISHSLGTVVAYSLMRVLSNIVNPKLLFTAGSPLGIQIVKKRLGQPLIFPPNIAKWINASDPEDFVALMPKLDLQTFGCDGIHNILEIDNGVEDPHDILKYLAHSAVAEGIIVSI